MPSAPLNYVSSADSSNPIVSSTLPQEVISCLKNARFLHLATCTSNIPHISLMNYTYLPSTPFYSLSTSQLDAHPTIIMTTNPTSRKTSNLLSNPNVSLLVHDWVSHRPATTNPASAAEDGAREGSPPPRAQGSSLASLLLGLNTAALGRISVTINGTARVLEPGEEEEVWCRERHVENHQFGEGAGAERNGGGGGEDGGTECFVEGEGVKVVVVRITGGRIADWKGGVRDFVVGDEDEHQVNGVG